MKVLRKMLSVVVAICLVVTFYSMNGAQGIAKEKERKEVRIAVLKAGEATDLKSVDKVVDQVQFFV